MKTKIRSGIYAVKINHKFEVGYSKNFQQRWNNHRCHLEKNRHWNILLQRAYNKYGKCEFIALEETDKWLPQKEIMWIEKLKSKHPTGYNLTGGGDGGDTFSLLDEEAKKRRSAKASKTMKDKKHNVGEKNGMFGCGERHPMFGTKNPGINKGEKNGQYKGVGDKEVYDAYLKEGSFEKAALVLPLHPTRIHLIVRRYEKENNLPKTSFVSGHTHIKTEDLVADREAGMTYKEIAEKYGVSKAMPRNRIHPRQKKP